MNDSKKEEVTIEVDRIMCSMVMGIVKGYSESILIEWRKKMAEGGLILDKSFEDKFMEVIEEIHQKSRKGTLPAFAADYFEATGKLMDFDDKKGAS